MGSASTSGSSRYYMWEVGMLVAVLAPLPFQLSSAKILGLIGISADLLAPEREGLELDQVIPEHPAPLWALGGTSSLPAAA